MNSTYHRAYIAGSFAAAVIATIGVFADAPVLYGYVPGIIGGVMAVVGAVRFLKYKTDLAGFAATTCGFLYYQAFQANPVILPEFVDSIRSLAPIDTTIGVFLGNFTTGMVLLAYLAVSAWLRSWLTKNTAAPAAVTRTAIDRSVLVGFWVIFVLVGLPHVLFGQVVVGAYKNILYQRAALYTEEFIGFQVWGGELGASFVQTTLMAPGLFCIWLYLVGSRYKVAVWMTAPFVLFWTAGVALQGSRTYLVTLGFAIVVYFLGSPRVGTKAIKYGAVGTVALFLLVQAATLFRMSGLSGFEMNEFVERVFEIRGNEGTPSQIDGLEYFRTEVIEKDVVPNPMLGLVQGIVMRPIEGILMPLPRALFPWKPDDLKQRDFTIFFQNVRLGQPSNEAYFGASPGLMGRELIRYGFAGPFTLLFWIGLLMALADRFYAAAPASDFHRAFAMVIIALLVAEMRDWVQVWCLPFFPAIGLFGYLSHKFKRAHRRTGAPVPEAIFRGNSS